MDLECGMGQGLGRLWVWSVEWIWGSEGDGFGLWGGSRVRKAMGSDTRQGPHDEGTRGAMSLDVSEFDCNRLPRSVPTARAVGHIP